MDNDGLQADQSARLMAEISDLRRQLEKQNENHNQSGNSIPILEREKAALEREKSVLEKRNESLDNEVKEYKIDLASFSKLKDEKTKMLQTIEDLKKQLSHFGDENRDLKAQTLEEPRQKLVAEISDLRRQLEKQNENHNQSGGKIPFLEREKAALEREKAALEREKAALEREKSALEKENGSLDKEINKYKIELASFSKLKDEKTKMLQTISELAKDKVMLEKQLNHLQDDIKRLKSEKKAHVCKKDERNESTNDKIRFNLEKDMSQLKEQLMESRDECNRLKKEIEVHTSTEEYTDSGFNQIKVKERLRQMTGAQLMTNNQNIAELSAAIRPSKITEQYTELYDCEWTDVYEVLEVAGYSDLAIIDTLYKMLLDSFRYCEETSVEQTKQLKLTLTSVQKKGDVISDDEIIPTKLSQLRELKKAFAPDMIESIYQSYKKDRKPKYIDRSEMKEFVHKCITVCWFMAVQDPPVVIDTKRHTGTFNGALFRPYTTTGKTIDFIVWPPLYLHDGGPMLSKGIAQGK